MSVETFPLPAWIVVAVLVLFSVLYQLNARITPWATWYERAEDGYLRSWGSYVVLNWVSAAAVVGLLLASGSSVGTIGLSIPSFERTTAFCVIYLGVLLLYYQDVIARTPLEEPRLEGNRDGWTPATFRQRVLHVFAASITPGICEEIVYRGFAVTAFLSFGFDRWVAVGLATVPYILLHGKGAFVSLRSFGYYATLGVVFGSVFLRAGSLWPAIVVHASYNLLVTIRNTRNYHARDRREPIAPRNS